MRSPHQEVSPWHRAKHIAFFVCAALVLGPFLAYGVEWTMGVSSVPTDEKLVAVHIAGIIAMLAWSIICVRSHPRTARVGLVLTTLVLIGWAIVFFS